MKKMKRNDLTLSRPEGEVRTPKGVITLHDTLKASYKPNEEAYKLKRYGYDLNHYQMITSKYGITLKRTSYYIRLLELII